MHPFTSEPYITHAIRSCIVHGRQWHCIAKYPFTCTFQGERTWAIRGYVATPTFVRLLDFFRGTLFAYERGVVNFILSLPFFLISNHLQSATHSILPTTTPIPLRTFIMSGNKMNQSSASRIQSGQVSVITIRRSCLQVQLTTYDPII